MNWFYLFVAWLASCLVIHVFPTGMRGMVPVTDQRMSRTLSSLQRLEGHYSESGICFLDV